MKKTIFSFIIAVLTACGMVSCGNTVSEAAASDSVTVDSMVGVDSIDSVLVTVDTVKAV